MPATRIPNQVLILEPDSRVRHALTDLVGSISGLSVFAACATADQAEAACRAGRPDAALVSVGSDRDLPAVTRLAEQVPVLAVASVCSLAPLATAAGASAFYDEDGDVEALVAALREVLG